MISNSLRLGFLLITLLPTGCQTSKATFSFRPAAAPLHASPPLPPASRPATPVSVPAVAPSARAAFVRPTPTTRWATQAKALYRVPTVQPTEAAGHSTITRQLVKRRPRTVAKHETRHLVLGLLLLAGGVITGLVIGGWAGFGVAALVVLGGYYFLGLAFGGEHAWLEVFQEFFNM